MYDYVIVTHLPAFYKVNLYNEIGKDSKIFVIFIAGETNEKRFSNFSKINKVNFDYTVINSGSFQKRCKFKSLIDVVKLLFSINYNKIIVSGWDLPEFWITVLLSKYNKNCLALESTVLESNTNGIRGVVKKLFLSRVSTVFASGALHVQLLNKLACSSSIKVTRGVGVINKSTPNINHKSYNSQFIFIGRLVEVKNLELLISVFNQLPNSSLTIVGEGELESTLREKSNDNINFLHSIDNNKLNCLFNKYDFLILPSLAEPWGLVVEEALYFGLPVIVSKQCGSSELIENNVNGYIFDAHNGEQLKDIINSVNVKSYFELQNNIDENFINNKDLLQVKAYEVKQ
ncbi:MULTISPECIES: glycosyltransferase [unclassified Pseudoalteromonas]|uniref:glycosyltransferase n=1 Tax=unclassified Pseudoalteromonas TaxID=194690 RepID=UPI001107E59C|nr:MULTISPECIES: glycosyltransferase [unclassified Pseudoalteromonas]TMN78119.1 glycosyl transferase [Pseudoalteromonas sp. S410]TMN90451.1 glycosyl transferase [Pseudoalteromonas sp. S408]TMN96469.1 glycosyl transferase [Pseudoalteromonas sp. S407]TMO00604.1 glycosyl transferase [Pseudoalteromonas sp. S409]TMO07572.1 glycosyl transferase [Pseudoalteromonas sp. S186]